MKKTVGFIGAGRITNIMVQGWRNAMALPDLIVLYDVNMAAAESFIAPGFPIEVTSDIEIVLKQDIVFLAVHPPVIPTVAESIRKPLPAELLLVCLAPQLTISRLSDIFGGHALIARLIPNAPSITGNGFNPWVCSNSVTLEDRARLSSLLEPLGACPEVQECHLEGYAILSAMGPTYFWPQIFTLQSLGMSFGLSKEAALEAVVEMLTGALASLQKSNLTPEELQNLIPMKPMAQDLEILENSYNRKLAALWAKIKP